MIYGYIYIIKNNVNGKFYIGQTTNLSKRKELHLCGHSDCPALKNAIGKYGRDNFTFSILATCSSLSELNACEIYWIRQLNTLSPNGYNLKQGGECGGKLSDETKEKISKSKKDKLLGKDNPMFGKKHSKASVKKMSDAHKGLLSGNKNPMFGKFGSDHPHFGKKHSEATKEKIDQYDF